MIIPLPKLAETTDVVVVDSWEVDVGDIVTEGDVLLTAETDKALVDVNAPARGTVTRLLAAVGEEIRTGDPVCEIEP